MGLHLVNGTHTSSWWWSVWSHRMTESHLYQQMFGHSQAGSQIHRFGKWFTESQNHYDWKRTSRSPSPTPVCVPKCHSSRGPLWTMAPPLLQGAWANTWPLFWRINFSANPEEDAYVSFSGSFSKLLTSVLAFLWLRWVFTHILDVHTFEHWFPSQWAEQHLTLETGVGRDLTKDIQQTCRAWKRDSDLFLHQFSSSASPAGLRTEKLWGQGRTRESMRLFQ